MLMIVLLTNFRSAVDTSVDWFFILSIYNGIVKPVAIIYVSKHFVL